MSPSQLRSGVKHAHDHNSELIVADVENTCSEVTSASNYSIKYTFQYIMIHTYIYPKYITDVIASLRVDHTRLLHDEL
jgi:hypothetical protein